MQLRIKQLNSASLEQVYTAASCISLFGMEEVVKLVKHLCALDTSPKSRSARNYMALLNTAVLAGRIAAQWAKIKPDLTAAQQNILPEHFMMMSLFSNQRPIGIIFADIGSPPHNPPMQPAEYIEFKSLCLAASKSLSKLAIIIQKKETDEDRTINQR
jgi:hypothetical protein